nr:MAG TPA: hypothetical protein [Caudoviricetes sp.]DAQ72040.1 MAG TPA: hypothetical protein [Bacteriophage sp.]DAW90779.1 MAG TPA: hypothetical protein [Bacteriophage sp.]
MESCARLLGTPKSLNSHPRVIVSTNSLHFFIYMPINVKFC